MLTKEQIKEAIDQMKVSCDLAYANDYEMVSARSVLNELGYGDDVEQILIAISEAGFNYCLDSHIKHNSANKEIPQEYPDQQVCWWGPDQLKSRLESIAWQFN
jgi:hypothetical protein